MTSQTERGDDDVAERGGQGDAGGKGDGVPDGPGVDGDHKVFLRAQIRGARQARGISVLTGSLREGRVLPLCCCRAKDGSVDARRYHEHRSSGVRGRGASRGPRGHDENVS
jgi:hypothetical protein